MNTHETVAYEQGRLDATHPDSDIGIPDCCWRCETAYRHGYRRSLEAHREGNGRTASGYGRGSGTGTEVH